MHYRYIVAELMCFSIRHIIHHWEIYALCCFSLFSYIPCRLISTEPLKSFRCICWQPHIVRYFLIKKNWAQMLSWQFRSRDVSNILLQTEILTAHMLSEKQGYWLQCGQLLFLFFLFRMYKIVFLSAFSFVILKTCKIIWEASLIH